MRRVIGGRACAILSEMPRLQLICFDKALAVHTVFHAIVTSLMAGEMMMQADILCLM